MQPCFRLASAGTSELTRQAPKYRLRRLFALFVPILLLSGCGHLFFYPSKGQFISPDQIGLQYEDVYLTTPDGETLHGWLLRSEEHTSELQSREYLVCRLMIEQITDKLS